jgi:hypothetical protein
MTLRLPTCALAALVLCGSVAAQNPNPAPQTLAEATVAPVQSDPPASLMSPTESQRAIADLRDTVAKQSSDIKALQEKLGWVPIVLAVLAVGGALITAIVAVVNQNRQANAARDLRQAQSEQERLLKAIDIIMQSRNGHQAEVRAVTLARFLDPAAKDSFKDIRENFSGNEYADMRVALVSAMSEKVTTPHEVIKIWQDVLGSDSSIGKIVYPPQPPKASPLTGSP